MTRRWRLKPGKSLRENARVVVPLMVDDFLSKKRRVINHPRLKQDLHRMRIAGKTLRYAMEVFESGFQTKFSSNLDELKQLLDVMGQIHDCDVNIPRLQSFLREIRLFNRMHDNLQDRLSTSALIRIIDELSSRRRALFVEISSILDRWDHDHFREGLLQSLESDNLSKE